MPSAETIMSVWREMYLYEENLWMVSAIRSLVRLSIPHWYAEECFVSVHDMEDPDLVISELLGITDPLRKELATTWQNKILVPYIIDGFGVGDPPTLVQARIEDAIHEWVATGEINIPGKSDKRK